jgi:pyruvate kinase
MKSSLPLSFRRTKIVATLGPASSTESTIGSLIEAGVNVFRLNFSHGTQDEHAARTLAIRGAAARLGTPVAILADLSGPKIRVGLFEEGAAELRDGETVIITSEPVLGTAKRFSSQYEELPGDVEPGSRILLDDGNLELRVRAVSGTEVTCTVVHGGRLKDKKGMNLPNVKVSAPALTEKDRDDARFAAQIGVDFIALSFVRRRADIDGLRQLLAEARSNALVVAKIEKPEALEDIDGILDASDAIMVARGDLGVELDLARVPNVQEELVDRARAKRKPVIVATQMLESMITSARPTRAEVTDVANAVRSGADAVMLSAETAAGHFPLGATETLDSVVRQTEAYLVEHGGFGGIFSYTPTGVDVTRSDRQDCDAETAIAASVAELSRELPTCGIVSLGESERLLSLLSNQRPSAVVFVPARTPRAFALGCLSWGVLPVTLPDGESSDAERLVRELEAHAEDARCQGFWLLARSNDGKNVTLSLVPR